RRRDRFLCRGAGRFRRHRAALRNRRARACRRAHLSQVRHPQRSRHLPERAAHRRNGARAFARAGPPRRDRTRPPAALQPGRRAPSGGGSRLMSRVIPVHDAELVLDAQAELGEGPVWDPSSSCLLFVDILRGRVHRFNPATGALQAFDVGQFVGAVAIAESGDLVLAVRDGFARMNLSSGHVEMIAEVEADRPDQRMNDGKCDAEGRFWAGTMALDERGGAGALYRLDPDGQVHTMLRHVSISNGLDWSSDDRLMYFIDSPTQSVDLFDFDLTSGAITNRRSLVRVGAVHGLPDGLTLD